MPGSFPAAPPKERRHGNADQLRRRDLADPLGLAALLSAVANGGTLYWMQYPRSQDEVNTSSRR